MKKYLIEAVGSMFLLLTISLVGTPLAVGAILLALIYMGKEVSGGHYNPAFSLAAWMKGKLSKKDFKYYILFQLAGGVVAAVFYWLVVGSRYFPSPGVGVGMWKILLLELLFTFLFVFIFLTVTMSAKLKSTHLYGIVIGFTLMAISHLGLTYNPMISISSTFLDLCCLGKSIQYMPAYALGSFGGGVLAAYFHKFVHE